MRVLAWAGMDINFRSGGKAAGLRGGSINANAVARGWGEHIRPSSPGPNQININLAVVRQIVRLAPEHCIVDQAPEEGARGGDIMASGYHQKLGHGAAGLTRRHHEAALIQRGKGAHTIHTIRLPH